MKTQIITLTLILSLSSFGQRSNIDCSKTINKVPYFARQNSSPSKDSILLDLEIIKTCGNLDSIDVDILNGPMVAQITIQLTNDKKKVTYKAIIDSFNEFKKTTTYLTNREIFIASKTLEKKIVTIEEFENDRLLLQKIGMPNSELDNFKKFIEANPSQKLTYKEAFSLYTTSKDNKTSDIPSKIEFSKLTDIETAIKAGKENGKKTLLYFSCYGCINARKIEDRVLIDNKIKTLIVQNFNYFIAYTDDNSEDEITKTTVGKKFIKMQTDNFKTNYQPYFCIIDDSGKVLSEIGYTNKTEEFIEFLNKGLK